MAGEAAAAANAVKGGFNKAVGLATSTKAWGILAIATLALLSSGGATALAAAGTNATTATSLTQVFSNGASIVGAGITKGSPELLKATGSSLQWGAGKIGELASMLPG